MNKTFRKSLLGTGLCGLVALSTIQIIQNKEDAKTWTDEKTGSPSFPVKILYDTNRDGDCDKVVWCGITPGHIPYSAERKPTQEEIDWYKSH
jgi:hypothetical protein